MRFLLMGALLLSSSIAASAQSPQHLQGLIAAHARANGVPEPLVHRVIIRESRYNPRAIGQGGAMGLMQIKHATARAMGYGGPPSGLLDANTNMTYAVRYLAGAYRAARGNHDLAVSYYARGYYYEAKRQGFSPYTLARHTGGSVDLAVQPRRGANAQIVYYTDDRYPAR